MTQSKTRRKKRSNPINNIRIHEPSIEGDVQRYTKDFAKLQREWYEKLAQDAVKNTTKGFVDIEYEGYARTDASCAPLKTPSAPDQSLGDRGLTYHFYNLLSNFLTHNPRYGTFRCRVICRLFVAGVSYRKILKDPTVLKLIEDKRIKKFSLFIVFQTVNKFKEQAMLWNRENPEGLEYAEVLDAAEDAEGGEA